MNKQKLMYEAPTAQTFVVRFEGVICQSINNDTHTEFFDDGGYEDL